MYISSTTFGRSAFTRPRNTCFTRDLTDDIVTRICKSVLSLSCIIIIRVLCITIHLRLLTFAKYRLTMDMDIGVVMKFPIRKKPTLRTLLEYSMLGLATSRTQSHNIFHTCFSASFSASPRVNAIIFPPMFALAHMLTHWSQRCSFH